MQKGHDGEWDISQMNPVRPRKEYMENTGRNRYGRDRSRIMVSGVYGLIKEMSPLGGDIFFGFSPDQVKSIKYRVSVTKVRVHTMMPTTIPETANSSPNWAF